MAEQIDNPKTSKIKVTTHEEYWKFTILTVVLPIVGFILGVAYLTKRRKLDKKLGEHLLALSILFMLIWATGLMIYENHLRDVQTIQTQNQLQASLDSLSNSQQYSQDTTRQIDLKAIQGQLEASFAVNGYYPTLENINDANWRSVNMQGLDPSLLIDPVGNTDRIVNKPEAGAYAYQPVPTGCDNSSNDMCVNYTLTATLSTGKTLVYKALN